MSHSKGFLKGTCKGTLKKYGRKHNGIQQYRCGRCGMVENKKVRPCILFHQWKLDRRMKPRALRCKICNTVRPA